MEAADDIAHRAFSRPPGGEALRGEDWIFDDKGIGPIRRRAERVHDVDREGVSAIANGAGDEAGG